MGVQKRVVAANPVTEVEFLLTDRRYPFVAASTIEGASVILEEFIPRSEGKYAEFFSITGVPPARLKAQLAEHEHSEATIINEYENGVLLELLVHAGCPAVCLGELNALPRDVYSVEGEGRVVAEIPSSADTGEIVDQFLDVHDDAELVTKRKQPYVTPMFSHREFRDLVGGELTERQREALVAAHDAGYYEWPRDVTAESLAEEMGVSAATFHKHLRSAEQELVRAFFDDPVPSPAVATAG